MTDDIETDASTTQSISKVEPDQQQQGWTDEELMQFIEFCIYLLTADYLI